MRQAYLFVHFREKTTPDGEQIHFGISEDGFHWHAVNDGLPILWAFYGDKGVRDFTITHCKATGKYVILATDLSLAYGMRNQYRNSWDEISRNGSKQLAIWESEDLLHWTEQRLLPIGDESFGCLWAPDILYDGMRDDYIVHWSSSHAENAYGNKAIYCARTRDFADFTKPALLYRKADSGVIDSAIYEEDGLYYMFLKSEKNPQRTILVRAASPTGPYVRVETFDESMMDVAEGLYEGATCVRLEDGRWCLFLDYYGVKGAGQGYVPFLADSLASGQFTRADEAFSFPYGFKHGTILTISPEDYEKIQRFAWPDA